MTEEKLDEKIGDLAGIITKIKMNPRNNAALEEARKCINEIFPTEYNRDVCRKVIYTDNIDKMFFGVMVMPAMLADDVIKGITSDDKVIINNVYVELDSKLFDEALNLSVHEITALIIREIGHITTDSTPMEKVKKDLDLYLYSTNQVLKLSEVSHYKELLSYGIRDAIRKTTSIFEIGDRSKMVDNFDEEMGIKDDVIEAMKKIEMNGLNWNKDVDNKLIFLSWVIRLYKDVIHKRIDAINDLGAAIKLTASQLEKRELENIIARLVRIDDDSLIHEGVLDFFSKTRYDMKKNGIKNYEDDFYTLQFDANNVETEEEAMLLLHRINSRMAVLDDYLSSEDLTKQDRIRWTKLYNDYNKIRTEMSKKKLYTNKTRLYVNYGMDDYRY